MSNPKVELHVTNYGVITLELDQDKAPKSVANFLAYVNKGHYNNTVFHRVIPGFMVQGGGMDASMKEQKPNAPIKNEAAISGIKNVRGTLAMARTNVPDSATAQFFINLKDNDFLNPSPGNAGYAAFGKVVSGMEVVDTIAKVKTASRGFHGDVPVENINIVSVKRK